MQGVKPQVFTLVTYLQKVTLFYLKINKLILSLFRYIKNNLFIFVTYKF
jgi:hypothetical protein